MWRRHATTALLWTCLGLSAGCGPSVRPAAPRHADQPTPSRAQPDRGREEAARAPRGPTQVVVAPARRNRKPPVVPRRDVFGAGAISTADPGAGLFDDGSQAGAVPSDESTPPPPPPAADPSRLAAAGIRRLDGAHLTLYTDLPPSPDVDELPQVFDAAVDPWCDYFRLPRQRAAAWKIVAYVIDRKERFQATMLLPDDLPPFLHGYQRGLQLWLYEQPSAYYRRHMLLHEGTHAFMNGMLSGCGPPWYMEGLAELLATHRWHDGQLQLAYFPRRRDEVEQWGRIKIVRTEVAAGLLLALEEIMAYGPRAHLRTEPYAWCWAAAAFLDGHPAFADRFRQLPAYVHAPESDLTARFWQLVAEDRRQLNEQWQLFALNIDYGYDVAREAIEYAPPGEAFVDAREVRVQVDRGWQSTGLRLAADVPYHLVAAGRYQVGAGPPIWWCEPDGVTIRYVAGRPLGMLLAAVSDPLQPLAGVTPLAQPAAIGRDASVTFPMAGTLFLRINDAPAELADNRGEVTVRIAPAPPPAPPAPGGPDPPD